jgi:hypothetical protein
VKAFCIPSNALVDLGFLPHNLLEQCRQLIESYHEIYGYRSLPNILWKLQLGPFIEREKELNRLLKRASTTRSAKEANSAFVVIATTILALEVLGRNFAGWSTLHPETGRKALDFLRRNALSPKMPLTEFYVHSPNYMSSTAIAVLTPRG